MSKVLARRKILIIEDEPSVRNAIKTLVEGLGCDGCIASGGEALGKIKHEKYDAILLDLCCPDVPAQEVVALVQNVQPTLLGRVLVITGEVPDAKSLAVIERYFLFQVPGSRLVQDLPSLLRILLSLGASASPA